ncbi:MAG TPA: acetyl-CoA carboxylase biotin carboxyl carrier protein subunit, partial [Actinomycetota bacterium]|nr:acetyl-CoA carboxylase biotin carboxyl carrier protein subunit [Actinomycetota bacterium]
VLVSPGDRVEAGQTLVVLEAMKMENAIAATAAGVVAEVNAEVGKTAGAGEVLVRVDAQGRTEPERSP